MLLDPIEFKQFAEKVASLSCGGVAIDLETTGLSPHHGARAFLIAVSCQDLNASAWLYDGMGDVLALLCSNPRLRYAAHNAKFEQAFFRKQYGVEIQGTVYDTEVMERVFYNNHLRYGLQACAERRKLTKYPPMLAWLKENGPHYRDAPPELIIPYCEQDARLSYQIMEDQLEKFRHWDTTPVPIRPVVALECQTTPVLFEMEYHGLLLDVPYAQAALTYEQKRKNQYADEFRAFTGSPFVDSRKSLAPLFDALGIGYGKTEKGNASFSDAALSGAQDHSLVRLIFGHRDAGKRATTYWENFLRLATPEGRLHPNIQQTGAKTSRMSVRDPACQTWPDDGDDVVYPIRRAFIAEPDCFLVSIDWSQLELRVMVDEAGETAMIEAFENGFDFHQQVADMADVPRSLAKNGRFAKLYGAGDERIATTLGVPLEVAGKISKSIDATSPRVAQYCRELKGYARRNGLCYNWLGRRYFLDRGFEYKAPNFRIQGGCGEILRIALVELFDFIKKKAHRKTAMLLPIHDEVVFNVHKTDLHLLPEFKKIMVGAYRGKQRLDLDANITWGPNLHDQEAWHG